MNQLPGKFVNVVLSVECGRGMEFLKNKVCITANFNGRILESDCIPPQDSPPFNTELVWEVEKKELRKIRCGNVPLRVECVTIDCQNRKERVGFALLSLRSAQIIQTADQAVVSKWHKLIGCQADKRKCHPELYISLTLRDYKFNDQINIDCSTADMPFIIEEDFQSVEEQPVETKVRYFENGHIQIGDKMASKNLYFTLNLRLIEVYNLDSLLTESLVFQNNTSSYFLTFKILGIVIKTKPFPTQLCDYVELNERIVVNLLSTKDVLQEYFKTQTISINFFYGYDKLGVTKLNFDHVWNKEIEKCFFKLPPPDSVVPFGSTEKSPYITLEVWVEDKEQKEVEEELAVVEEPVVEKPKPRSIFSNVCKKPTKECEPKSSYHTEEPEKLKETEHIQLPRVIKSVDTVVLSETLSSRSTVVLDIYEKFIITINLKYLIWNSPPPDDKIMFKFLHPRAANCTTIFTEIEVDLNKPIFLNNVYVRMAYISTAAGLRRLLKHWRPKLVLADKNEEYITNKRTLRVNYFCEDISDYEEEFDSLYSLSPLAKIGINIVVHVCQTALEEDFESLFLLPVIVDEVITVTEIADLDNWKQEKKIIFECELNRIRNEEIIRLQTEYECKKRELQEKLTKAVEKCKNTHEQLKKKFNSMKFDKEFSKKQRNSREIYEEILKENLKRYSELSVEKLIEMLSETQRDNVLLKEVCGKQQEKVSKISKSMITKAETNNLLRELKTLEDQFIEARTAKSYLQEMLKQSSEESNVLNGKTKENNNARFEQQYQAFYTEID